MCLPSLFGSFAVLAMLVCYTLERRSRWFTLGGPMELIWSIVAFAEVVAAGSS